MCSLGQIVCQARSPEDELVGDRLLDEICLADVLSLGNFANKLAEPLVLEPKGKCPSGSSVGHGLYRAPVCA